MDLGTNTAALSMSPGHLGQLKLCFSPLTKIRFNLLADPEKFSTKNIRFVHQNVAKLLLSAVNLESLSLALVDKETRLDIYILRWRRFLEGVNFPSSDRCF